MFIAEDTYIQFAQDENAQYLAREPFPHVIIDNFFDAKALDGLYENFPSEEDLPWIKYDNPLERKLAFNDISLLGDEYKAIFEGLNGKKFLTFLEKLTGFDNIIADQELIGGGLHQIKKGGKLDIHADFNIHYKTKDRRCLNLILFLNKNWEEEYGGHLELWDRQMIKCRKKILPIFNRAVIFSTDETSYHGHPNPLECPEDWTRKSLALYYYVKNDDKRVSHSTKYMKRPEDPEDEKLEEFRKQRLIPKERRKV